MATTRGRAAGPADLSRAAHGLETPDTLGTAPSYAVPRGAAIGQQTGRAQDREEGVVPGASSKERTHGASGPPSRRSSRLCRAGAQPRRDALVSPTQAVVAACVAAN
jgi:hypothetical protein